jgi:hypothetical protein
MAEKLVLQQQLMQELSILQELKELSLQKQNAVLKDEFDLLEIIVLKEEALSINLKKIDDACSPQVQFFLRGENETKNDPSSIELRELIQQVHKSARKLKQNNDFNQNLIRDSLNIVQFMINSLFPRDDEASVYGSSGKVLKHKKETLLLDYKG